MRKFTIPLLQRSLCCKFGNICHKNERIQNLWYKGAFAISFGRFATKMREFTIPLLQRYFAVNLETFATKIWEFKLTILQRSFCRKFGDICLKYERIQINNPAKVFLPYIWGHLPQKGENLNHRCYEDPFALNWGTFTIKMRKSELHNISVWRQRKVWN